MIHLADSNNWCRANPFCKGNLGIPRRRMPQIKRKHAAAFRDFLEEHGVRTKVASVSVRDLKATQREIFPEMVALVLEDQFHKRNDRPVWASQDDYILDGHHRWAAWLEEDPRHKMRLFQAQAPMRKLIELAAEFPQVEYSTRGASLRRIFSYEGLAFGSRS